MILFQKGEIVLRVRNRAVSRISLLDFDPPPYPLPMPLHRVRRAVVMLSPPGHRTGHTKQKTPQGEPYGAGLHATLYKYQPHALGVISTQGHSPRNAHLHNGIKVARP